mmetsp:Transcript_21112/g.32734  ORF Transcript_21112/g.32734 Transcript_21112/m.32734 type:complete len:97 (+) Transcript_21112:730-1020(+)
MTTLPWSKGSGESTCINKCPDGFTSNGDDDLFKCVPCDETCVTCQDNGQVGDIKRCTECSESFPNMYSPEARCMEVCNNGFYEVVEKQCDKCDDIC